MLTAHKRTGGTLAPLRHPVVAVALGMIALQLVFRAWAVYSGYFYTDDYMLLLDAQRDGLTSDYLFAPVNSHLLPASRFLIWLVSESGALNWGLAASIALVIQAVASVAALWMLVVLFGRRWWVLAPLGIYLTSAITAQASLWWISSLNQVSINAMFFVAVAAWVVYLRSRRLRWLFLTALAVAVGLMFFQKILLVLPVLIFLAFVYFSRGSFLQRLTFLVRSYWPALLVMGGVSGAYGLHSLLQVSQPFTGSKDVDLLRLTWNMGSSAVTGALGGPWTWDWRPGGSWAATSDAVVLVSVAVALVIVVVTSVARERAWWGWALLAGYLGLEVALVATSRAPVFGAQIGLAYRLQTDTICALVLSLGLVTLPVLDAPNPLGKRRPIPGQGLLPERVAATLPAVTVVLICLSGLISWSSYAEDWHQHNASKRYLAVLDGDLARTGVINLVDEQVPNDVLPAAFFAPDNRVSNLAGLLHRTVDFPRAASTLATVAADGSVHEAFVAPQISALPGPHPNCGWLGTAPRLEIPLTGSTYDLDWWVRLGYLSNRADSVTITLGDDRIETHLVKGLANLYVHTEGVFDSVVISDLAPETKVCVDVVEVGTMTEGRRQ